MIGVNLAGGEFGQLPGVYARQYIFPGPKQFDYCKAKGLAVVRLPFRWERLQPSLMDSLSEEELVHLDETVKLASQRGIKLLLDVHNYARYRDKLIGTPEVPNEAFADFWKRLAEHYRDEDGIFAYGLMNEPHDTGGRWPAASQAAVDAIRSVDRRHTISVCGDGWSGAHSWDKINKDLLLSDPANLLIYEAHQYFDGDNSGTYRQSYDDCGADPQLGVKRLEPFVRWLKQHNARGFLGEFGVPDDDPRWLELLDTFLAELKRNQIGGTYWAAGPWWGNYPQSAEPRDGKDRPQMEVLELYAGNRAKPADAKPSYADALARVKRAPPKPTQPGKDKVIYDLGKHQESYHYSNEGSEFASEPVEDGGRTARKFTYKHHGQIAWIGVGLYFGSLECGGHRSLRLAVRAEKPCKLEVKAYPSDDKKYSGVFAVGTEWQELVIPLESLMGEGGSFQTVHKLHKIEFQPSTNRDGSSLWMGALELAN